MWGGCILLLVLFVFIVLTMFMWPGLLFNDKVMHACACLDECV